MFDPVPISIKGGFWRNLIPPAELDRRRDYEYLRQHPSALLRFALEDLDTALATGKYDFWFGTWHSPRGDGKVAICVAGARMAVTLEANPDARLHPSNFSHVENALLRAISLFSDGDVSTAFYLLRTQRRGPRPLNKPDLGYFAYRDLETWRRGIETLITELEAAGY
jgi:hypothetical protein